MLRRLLKLLASPAQPLLPVVLSTVRGFSVHVERKDGCVLRTRPAKSKEEVPFTDAGADWHLEVTVTYDGTNPFYQGKRGPWRRLMTNALRKEQGFGMASGLYYRPPDEKFTRIEVFEKFEDYHDYECFGGFPIPDHMVWLKVYTIDGRGVEQSFSVGLTTRSEGTGRSTSYRMSDGSAG